MLEWVQNSRGELDLGGTREGVKCILAVIISRDTGDEFDEGVNMRWESKLSQVFELQDGQTYHLLNGKNGRTNW